MHGRWWWWWGGVGLVSREVCQCKFEVEVVMVVVVGGTEVT